MPFKVLDAPSL